MNGLYTTKGGGLIKDVDVKTGTITGYGASFNTLDSDGDIFQKGAFKKSITENKSRIMLLQQHNTNLPIARPEILKEDSNGLYFEAKITENHLKVGYVKDVLALYDAGVFNEHSVGFQTIKDHTEQRQQKDVNIITEAKLWEISVVTWGANENTPFLGVKSLEKPELLKKFDAICKSLRVGGLTDETYINLEIELQQIKALVSQLLPGNTTKGTNEPQSDVLELLRGLNID